MRDGYYNVRAGNAGSYFFVAIRLECAMIYIIFNVWRGISMPDLIRIACAVPAVRVGDV